MRTTPAAIALFPTYERLQHWQAADYPSVAQQLDEGSDGFRQAFAWGREFLTYIGRNKSGATYVRFRNEIERFVIWSYQVHGKAVADCKKADILAYVDFCWQPPVEWIADGVYERFQLQQGQWVQNPAWRPFRAASTQPAAANEAEVADSADRPIKTRPSIRYQPSQETLAALFTALVAFYKFLIHQEQLLINPAQQAKVDCRYLTVDAQVTETRRLSDTEWHCLITTAEHLANQDPLLERNLFVVCALKTLFLRISELSERDDWIPVMKHFWQDRQGNWWLKVLGKGRKIRDITVPDDFLHYLKRYRRSRNLSALPSPQDQSPLVEKIRGHGGMTARHLTRLVQQVLDAAYDRLSASQGSDAAQKLRIASTHWLRHTGASMEIERGRHLKDVSEDLGHASMATTDTIYVQTDSQVRARSGKGRRVL
jgi:site-specific recombinase XerC